jgi:hypothetical protein
MRIYTITCNGMAAAVVRAEDPSDAVATAQALGGREGLHGKLAAREPDDGEMVSWLEHRSDHLLPAFVPMAIAS